MLILVTKYCNKELSLSLGAMVIGNRENESAGTLKKGLKNIFKTLFVFDMSLRNLQLKN